MNEWGAGHVEDWKEWKQVKGSERKRQSKEIKREEEIWSLPASNNKSNYFGVLAKPPSLTVTYIWHPVDLAAKWCNPNGCS